MYSKTVSYEIETEVPSSYSGNLLDFVYQKYLSPQRDRFKDFSRNHDEADPGLINDARAGAS